MKRDAPGHGKIADLAHKLGIPRYGAVGIFECLIHATGKYAFLGDIGKLSNVAIAEQVYWDKDPDVLIKALVEVRLIDVSKRYRLVVHDWHDHCEDWVKKRVERSGLPFASLRRIPAANGRQRQTKSDIEADNGILAGGQGKGQGQGIRSEGGVGGDTAADTRGQVRISGRFPRHTMAAMMGLYPAHRRTKSLAAQNAMDAALCRIADAKGHPGTGDPMGYMGGRLRSFAESWAGNRGQWVPHLTNWLENGNYDDPPEAWNEPPPESGNGSYSGGDIARELGAPNERR